jgi:hypothetical protein
MFATADVLPPVAGESAVSSAINRLTAEPNTLEVEPAHAKLV